MKNVPSRDVATIKENARVHIRSIVVHVVSTLIKWIKEKLVVLTRFDVNKILPLGSLGCCWSL